MSLAAAARGQVGPQRRGGGGHPGAPPGCQATVTWSGGLTQDKKANKLSSPGDQEPGKVFSLILCFL